MRRPAGYTGLVRMIGLLLILSSCRGPSPRSARDATPTQVAIASSARSCSEAAVGFESGTRGIRPAESTILVAIRLRCVDDVWPAVAIECFAKMAEGDFGRCAAQLPQRARDRMFAILGSGGHAPGTMNEGGNEGSDGISPSLSIERSLTKLQALQVGISTCDRFVATVTRLLVCERMSVELRAQLGAETADFWSLPTTGLPESARQKMVDVCTRSLAVLEQQALDVGCMP
jgi:hypothetical protein